jgi:hypothetical protein
MSQDIAAVILVLAAAIVPVALTLVAKLRTRRRRRRTVKTASGISVRSSYVPRHLAAGGRRPAGADYGAQSASS